MNKNSLTSSASAIPPVASSRIVLEIQGMGHVPAFKNKKRAIHTKSGKMRTLTDPETKKWMVRCETSLEFQLCSAFRIGEDETLTGPQARSLIASALPEDDCWSCVPELNLKAEKCNLGEEGATIIIERIDNGLTP